MTPPGPDSRFLVVAVAFAFLYVFPHQPRINNPNENVRFYMTAAIVEEGRYEIDSLRERWGWVNDASTRNGHYYSVKAPGTSILAIPGYAAYEAFTSVTGRAFDRQEALWLCRFTSTILPTWIGLCYVLAFFRKRGEQRMAEVAFAGLALGSPIYAYTMMLASHTTAALAAFGAFMALCSLRPLQRAPYDRCVLAGVMTAAVTWLEYQGLVASVVLAVLGVVMIWPRGGVKGVCAFATGGLVLTLSSMHFQYHAFGNAFSPGHLSLETSGFRTIHSKGFYGVVGVDPDALRVLLVDLGGGLFPIAPLFIAGLAGLVMLLRVRAQRADAIAALSVVGLTTLAVASTTYWRGGWTIGPRYLVLTMPFLAYGALHALTALREKNQTAAYGLGVGWLAAGLVASGIPSAYYPHLPPEFSRPLPQLFLPLISEGYAPYTAAGFVGVRGTVAMLPLAGLFLAVLLYPLRGLSARALARAGGCALIIAALSLAPLWVRPEREPGVAKAVKFVKDYWPVEQGPARERARQRGTP